MATLTRPSNSTSQAVNTSPFFGRQLRGFTIKALVTLFTCTLLFVYLLPLGNMMLTSISTREQLSQDASDQVIPTAPVNFTYEGEEYPVYNVPMPDGTTQQLALVDKHRSDSDFVDPANPDAGLINWEGSWRTLTPVRSFAPAFENFGIAWEQIEFPKVFANTLIIAFVGMIGTLLSCICVAYAFARFPIPGKNIMFIILIGTIILPQQVTLIPTYAFFSRIGWTNTMLPLIVPHFFANAYNVFLLRQYFLTLPKELDEAAMIDGAGPFKVLTSVIIPQSWPAIIAVGVFHFVWAWNDFFGPLIYLIGAEDLQPISVAVQRFNFAYGPHPELIQATSMMALVLPLIIFFLAQRVFMRGVVITGVEK
ncbi:MAG: carbohydrate ABC transporter permease [Anaerolineae bacterium]